MRHEDFIHKVADLALARLDDETRAKVNAKIVYGGGIGAGARGYTLFGAWTQDNKAPMPIVEICATAEEGPTQVAGTTIHELAHVLAGPGAGHDKAWKAACELLGLRRAKAAGMRYTNAAFAPDIRAAIASMEMVDGAPVNGRVGLGRTPVATPRPCSHGVGSRGGKSRGPGSGSRLRKYVCECAPKPVIVRVSSDTFAAHCDNCGTAFKRA